MLTSGEPQFALLPEFKGREFLSSSSFFDLKNIHPQLYRKAINAPLPTAPRFRGFVSPAQCCWDEYGHLEPRLLSKAARKRVLSVVSAGSAWERKYPQIDFRVNGSGGLVGILRRSFPKVTFSDKAYVSVTEIYTHYRDVLKK
jgi:hypothetical protein